MPQSLIEVAWGCRVCGADIRSQHDPTCRFHPDPIPVPCGYCDGAGTGSREEKWTTDDGTCRACEGAGKVHPRTGLPCP